MDALFLGYDPGGDGNHGVASFRCSGSLVISAEASTETTVEKAAAWFIARMERAKAVPVALGVDTMTAWSTGRCGWRPADRKLKLEYPVAAKSVASSNSLFGAMAVNGMLMLMRLKERDPALQITETHPKVLHYALASVRHDYAAGSVAMTARLANLLGLTGLALKNDHEWDAVISAYAAYMGWCGRWTVDLHDLPPEVGESIVYPVGKTYFYWPPWSS